MIHRPCRPDLDTTGAVSLRLLLLPLILPATAGCMDLSKDAGGPPMTASAWLDRRDLAEVAHCPPPATGRGETDACQHLAWGWHP